jgi:RNA polymerase sigma factor (sigma-70 family)
LAKFCALEEIFRNIHQDLIDACKTGDRKAQFKIYKLYYKAMYNTSLRIVNDTAEAEDIMQESFLDAFRRIDTYTGEGSFGMWLKRIVVNNSLDVLRRRKEIVSYDEIHLDFAESQEESHEEEIQFEVRVVRETISQLPEEYRVVLSLFLLEGYDHEEISQILNISNNLSRTRFSRARQKLLQILKENRFKTSFIYN